jgi:hypothetical protein
MIDADRYRRTSDRLAEAVRLHQSLMDDPHPGLATWQQFRERAAAAVNRAYEDWRAARSDSPEPPR